MQELHLVGFTTDLEALIFSARKGAKSGSFVVSLDAEVIAKIEEALRLRTGGEGTGLARRGRSLSAMAAPRQESSLSPKQMQARLRSGRTISDVAREAGVDDDWVARFAAPILAEQAQIIGDARERAMTKPRLGGSSQPLDVAVRWNLGDRGIFLDDDEYEEGWGARNLRDTLWLVTFQYESRKREQRADWELEHTTHALIPKNRLASDLGYVEPGRRRGPVPPRPSAVATTRAVTHQVVAEAPLPMTPAMKKAAAKKAAAEKVAAKKAAAKKAAADRVEAKKLAKRLAVQRAAAKRAAAKQATAAKKTAARLAAARKASEERAIKQAAARARAAKKAAADKEAARKAAARKAAARKAIPRKKAAAKKAAAKKTAGRKTAAKKTSAKKTAAKKTAARRPTPKKTAPKKVIPRKAAPKKATARRAASRKSAPKKAVARRPATKKPAARRASTRATTPKRAAPRKVATRKAPAPRKVASSRRAPAIVSRPTPAPVAASMRTVSSTPEREVGRSAAAAYLESRRRAAGQPARPAATPLRPVSGGAPPVVIRATPASAGPVEPEVLPIVIGNGADVDEDGARSRLRRRRPLRGR